MRATYSLVVLLLALIVGLAAAGGSKMLIAAVLFMIGTIAAIAILAWRQSVRGRRRRPPVNWARAFAATAIWLYMASTLTYRGRSATQISSNPLDSAGLVRVAFMGAAVLVSVLALQVCAKSNMREWFLVLPTKLYIVYVALAVAGIAAAVGVPYATFSVGDLAISIFVVLVAIRAYRGDGIAVLRVVLGFLAFLVATAVVGVLISPSRALVPYPGSPIPIRLTGLYPDVSFNTLGEFGLFFFAAGLAGLKPRRSLMFTGVALIVLSQYRTGYIALVLVVLVYLVCHKKATRTVYAAGICVGGFLLSQTPAFQSIWTRGSAGQVVGSFSGRTPYWVAAIHAVGRSPFIGLGLRSGTRFEVLVSQSDAGTSSVHNTWIEALVGVGILGLTALLLSFGMVAWRSIRERHTPEGLLALLFIVSLAIRSMTGTTFEIGGLGAPVYASVICIAYMPARRRRQQRLDAARAAREAAEPKPLALVASASSPE